MKAQRQLISHDPENGREGDCYRTCVAIILGIDAHEVEHVCDLPSDHPDAGDWIDRMRRWLAYRGLTLACYGLRADSVSEAMMIACKGAPDIPVILGGTGKGGFHHAVVVMNGALWCDPAGTDGLVGADHGGGGKGEYMMHLIVPLWAEGD